MLYSSLFRCRLVLEFCCGLCAAWAAWGVQEKTDSRWYVGNDIRVAYRVFNVGFWRCDVKSGVLCHGAFHSSSDIIPGTIFPSE